MKGPVSPLKASLEESSLVVHWLRLHVSTTGITGSIPLLGELRFFSCRMAYPPPTPNASLKATGRIFYFAALGLHYGLWAL